MHTFLRLKFVCLFFLSVATFSLLTAPFAVAIQDETNDGRWEEPCDDYPDAIVPGFLVNLGPTGARAVLTANSFIVKYIFDGSPAIGQLQIGDEIVGANASAFSTHTFGKGKFGYDGPIMDFGNAIEQAEAGDGLLTLEVIRGKNKMNVEITLDPIGRFSETFPFNCPKSDLILSGIRNYLASDPEASQGGNSMHEMYAALTLMTSNDAGQQAAAKNIVTYMNSLPGEDTWNWHRAFKLITLSEYYMLTKDDSVMSTMQGLVQGLRDSQYKGDIIVWTDDVNHEWYAAQQLYLGGFGHPPYIPGVGNNGYGPMQPTTILAVIGWQLARRCGVEVDQSWINDALTFMDYGTTNSGMVAYGGEFTLNNGLQDPAEFKKRTSVDDVGRVGLALVGHKLCTENPAQGENIKKLNEQLVYAHKSMADGHASTILNLGWGLLGTCQMDDQAGMRTILEHFKAWFNMARCHDGSFVVNPGRSSADNSYYRGNRYGYTAMMGLFFSMSEGKLLIQGAQSK
ncbi:MAG: hypothetical protein GY874_21090 [Desulfobacteraceae bacterium]|nr:hypothetical protein [Desulfobacteraceae bacterium]